MKFYRILAIARKETTQVVRDWRSLILAIGIPFALLLLFGFALSLDVDRVPVMIWDQSRTPESRDLISRFAGSRYFSPTFADNYHMIERAIDKRETLAALVIPVDYASKIHRQQEAPVQFIVDGSDSNTATLAIGYAEGIIQNFSLEMNNQTIQLPIKLDTRVWYNPELESTYTIVPGLISMIMMVIAALLTSLTVAREWERGTMEQLISTPIQVSELIIGKLAPYFVIAMIDVWIVILVGQFVFEVPLRGSLVFLLVMSVVFLIGSLSLGLLISIIAKSQLMASQLAMVLTFLPSFLLSGFFTSISNMPIVIQWISYGVPARYFMQLLKGIYLKGLGLTVLWTEVLLLIIYAIVMFLLAQSTFKKKLD